MDEIIMKILVDKNVDLRKLEEFIKNKNLVCDLMTLRAENKVRRIKKKATGLIVLGGPTSLDNQLGGEDEISLFNRVKEIIGKQNLGDCLHVESAIFNNADYLITEDKDFLSKVSELSTISNKPKILNLSGFMMEIGDIVV